MKCQKSPIIIAANIEIQLVHLAIKHYSTDHSSHMNYRICQHG